MLCLVLMMLLDASFATGAESLEIALCVRSDHGMKITKSELVHHHGTRMGIISALSLIFLVGVFVAFVGELGSGSLGSFSVLIMITCFSVCVLTHWESFVFRGFLIRMKFRSSQISRTCADIRRQWPHISDPLSKLGLRLVSTAEGHSECHGVERCEDQWSTTDSFGPLIYRNENSIILDSATLFDWKIVFLESEAFPKAFHVDFEGSSVAYIPMEWKSLGEKLFLVKYDTSIEPRK